MFHVVDAGEPAPNIIFVVNLLQGEMYTVYVLYSQTYNKIYIGYTSDLTQRFLSHNVLAKKGYTCRYRPWIIAYYILQVNI